MASFDERVNAAMEGFCAAKMDGKGTEESVCNALCAADAAEPEIGAVRRWLAGEAVDEATLPERLREVLSERDEARVRLEHSTDWYQQRFNRLRRWVNEEVRPLSSEVATRYFAICANGSPAPHESADWSGTMHALKLANECGVRDLAAARAEVERLKRELDEERAWMREEKRHNIRMRAALDEIAVCLGRDGDDDLKVLVDDVQRCSDGVVAADEKIERLTQERDALAAKVREQTAALACIESLGTSGNETQRPSACIARETRLSIQRRTDAAAKGETPVPWEDVKKRLGVSDPARLFSLDIGCDNGQDGDGCVFVAVVRRGGLGTVGEWRGDDLLRALLADVARFDAHEGYEHIPPTGAPDDGGDVIDWKARALAAEAEDEARAQEVDQLRARIVELETEVARLRAALERETAPRMWVGRMAGVEPCTRCGAKWVD